MRVEVHSEKFQTQYAEYWFSRDGDGKVHINLGGGLIYGIPVLLEDDLPELVDRLRLFKAMIGGLS